MTSSVSWNICVAGTLSADHAVQLAYKDYIRKTGFSKAVAEFAGREAELDQVRLGCPNCGSDLHPGAVTRCIAPDCGVRIRWMTENREDIITSLQVQLNHLEARDQFLTRKIDTNTHRDFQIGERTEARNDYNTRNHFLSLMLRGKMAFDNLGEVTPEVMGCPGCGLPLSSATGCQCGASIVYTEYTLEELWNMDTTRLRYWVDVEQERLQMAAKLLYHNEHQAERFGGIDFLTDAGRRGQFQYTRYQMEYARTLLMNGMMVLRTREQSGDLALLLNTKLDEKRRLAMYHPLRGHAMAMRCHDCAEIIDSSISASETEVPNVCNCNSCGANLVYGDEQHSQAFIASRVESVRNRGKNMELYMATMLGMAQKAGSKDLSAFVDAYKTHAPVYNSLQLRHPKFFDGANQLIIGYNQRFNKHEPLLAMSVGLWERRELPPGSSSAYRADDMGTIRASVTMENLRRRYLTPDDEN